MNARSARSAGPGRPKDLEKRAAILAAAKHLFPVHGFEGTSMDAIAALANVSKLTVYSHFKDKESLFTEAIREKCMEQMPEELFDVAVDGSIREQLLAIARAFFRLITSEESMSLLRLLASGAGDTRKLGQMFWTAGAQLIQEEFAGFLRRKVEVGQLAVVDVERSASQFFCLVKGELHARQLCAFCANEFSEAEIDAHLKASVDFFLRACTPRAGT